MMKTLNKIIKLSDIHYVIVDDTEIEGGNWVYYLHNSGLHKPSINKVIKPNYSDYKPYSIHFDTGFGVQEDCKRITHSTQPLKGVKTIPLSEIEEAIYDYSVEKMAHKYFADERKKRNDDFYQNASEENKVGLYKHYDREFTPLFEVGFNAHKKLVKDKLFTIEDMKKALELSKERQHIKHSGNQTEPKYSDQAIIQSLLPKTEWDCTINEDGKITIIKLWDVTLGIENL